MKLKLILCFVFLLLLSNLALAKEPEWLKKMKQVKLLVDNYEDVIKIFGKPGDDSSDRELAEYFDFPEGRVWTNFETGKCVITEYSDGKPIGWKVPKYTVIQVGFSPDKTIDPKELDIDFKDFHAKPISDAPEAIEYINDQLGIDYLVSEGKIEDIIFRPAKKYDYLHCKEEDVR